MAPHSSTLAWKIPWMEEPGGPQSMGSLRFGQDSATSLSFIGEGNGNPLQCSCLENPRDGGASWAAIYGVAQSRTRMSNFTFIHFRSLEKEMATHSSVLAWRIPGTGEPSGLPSMGSHRVGHDWSSLAAAAAAYCHQLRKRDPTWPSSSFFISSSPILDFDNIQPFPCFTLWSGKLGRAVEICLEITTYLHPTLLCLIRREDFHEAC